MPPGTQPTLPYSGVEITSSWWRLLLQHLGVHEFRPHHQNHGFLRSVLAVAISLPLHTILPLSSEFWLFTLLVLGAAT